MESKKIYAFFEDDYLYFTNDPTNVEGGLPDEYMVFNDFETFDNFIENGNFLIPLAIVEL